MKLMSWQKKVFYNLAFYLLSTRALFAVYGEGVSGNETTFGDIAYNLSDALFGIANLWLAVSVIAGIAFLFIAIIKYKEYKINPQQTPIGKVFLMLFMGIVLISIVVIVQFGDSAYVMLQEKFG